MDFLARWDANFSSHQKRLLQLIEFIERSSKYSNNHLEAKAFHDEFSVCGALFIVRLVSAVKRCFNCAQPVDIHLRAMLIFFQGADWEQVLSTEDTTSCMHMLLTVASLDPSECPADVEQALLVLRRLLQSERTLPIFIDLGGVPVLGDVIERTLNTRLQRTCTSMLFDCAGHSDPSQVLETAVRLMNAPRGSTKYCSMSLCRQLLSSAIRRSHISACCGHQWLLDILPQILRLLVNRPIFYQYECAAFVLELLDMPDVASALLKHLTALLILRCVVGGVSAIDNDAWKFSDTQSRSMQKPELMKKPSKWGIVSKAVNSSSAVEDTMREAIAAVHISRNKPMAGSLAAGSQALVDVEIAQDPAVVVVRAVALLLNRCETVRIELAQSLPNRFGVGMPRHLLRPMSGDLDSLESEFLSHDMGLDSSVLLPAAHRSLALLGGRHANATVASLHSSLDSLIAAGMPITMIFNLLATVHRLVETKEAGLLRKLILLSGRPKSLNGPEGENTGADLTETYCTQPLQFNGSASRNGLSLEKFYHDGVAVSFLMLLYTLQRWVNIDAVAKSVVWDLLSEFGLLRVFDFFDYVEDFESLGEESSEEGSRYRIPEVGSMCAEAQLDLYALLIVYIRLVTDSPTDSRASVGYGRKRTDVRSNGSDLVARQRREPSAPESLDSDGSIVIDWSPQQSLSSAVEELRKRVGGGMLVSHLKSALLLGTSTDTRDRYVSVSRAERVQQRGRAVRERKTRSPYSHSRSRSRSFSPSRASHESYGAMFAACKTQTITSITTSFSVGLQDADDEALEVTEPVTVQEASGRSYEPSFQELLNAAMRGANLTDLKVKNSIIINSTRSNNSGKHGNERPSSRATCQSGSRGSSANGTRHSKPVDGPPTRLSKRQQDDLRARLADIRRPKSSTRSPINDHDPSVPSVVPIGALRRVHEGTAEPRVRTVGVAFDDEGDRDPSQPGKLVVPRIVVPTPPSSARGSFVPLAMPAESPVNPRHKSLQYVARRRHFRARDSPRAYTTQMTMRSTGEAGCALSLADGRGQSTEVMQELQAMLFDRLVDQDDFD